MGLKDTQAIARIRIHPKNPNIVYVAALGHPYGDNKERGIFRSKNGGKTWKKILYKSPKAGGVDIVIDRTNPKVIYASLWQVYRKAWKMGGGGPYRGIYKSTDGGDSWKELTENPGMPEGPIGKIGMAVSPADPKRVWAVVEAPEGGVFRSDNGGKSWKRTNDDRKIRQRHFYYSRVVADPINRDVVYALNTRLYKSTDGGVNFDTQISVPHGDNHDLWIDPNNPKRGILELRPIDALKIKKVRQVIPPKSYELDKNSNPKIEEYFAFNEGGISGDKGGNIIRIAPDSIA